MKYILYTLNIFFIIISQTSFSQNIVFSQEISGNVDGTSTVTFSATNLGVTENLGGYTIYYYYDNAQTTVVSSDFTNTSAGALNWGVANESKVNHQASINPLVPITSTGYFYYQNFDNNFTGIELANGQTIVLGSIIYNHSVGGPESGSGFISSSVQDPPISYINLPAFDTRPIVITGPQFGPLPISIKSFDAIKHSASSAKLDWTTSKEVNSDYFGIERSIDGSTWDEIARVKAAGDSNVDIAYDYIDDRLPLSRTNGQVFYYRLRMTDLDGAFKYSDVRGVNFDKQALGPISIYPNPTTEIVNIDLSEVVMEDGDVYVSVYDMSGRLVMTKQIIGSGIELIKVDQLPSDAYNFIIRQGELIHQQRVIKID